MNVPPCERPAITVVMPVHDATDWTERAIRALIDHTDPCFELSILDDASQARETHELFGSLTGARVERSEHVLGFGPASNRAAAGAHGEHLLFLNTDAVVTPGWLGPLLERIGQDGVGAVGPMLVNPDGTVQQAGALTCRDGGTALYGGGCGTDASTCTFPRTVDYLAAACLLVRRELFEALGGFDELFAPAYFEDADFCFRLAAQGWRTVYEPRSCVLHGLGASYDSLAIAPIASRNRLRFAERWQHVLDARPSSFAGPLELAARDAPAVGRVLVVNGETRRRRPAGRPCHAGRVRG